MERDLRHLQNLESEARSRLALQDRYYWLTECTRTKDEQDLSGNPFKPFPRRPYIQPVLEALDNEPIIFLEKSRTMMASWTVSGWAAYLMFTRPATGVVFQSEDEARAVHDVEYVKILWEQSLSPLRQRWKPLRGKHPNDQPYNSFEMENGSWCIGLPGNPDKVRSEHPTIVILDEAAHIVRGDQSFNIAKATKCLHIVALSSANPSWFREATKKGRPVDWPVYKKEQPDGKLDSKG